MPSKVILPKLSTTMDEGTIVRWLKQEGDSIAAGEPLFELETDKTVMDVEATDAGVLGRILFPAGSTVPIGQVVAYIALPGEDLGELPAPAAPVARASQASAPQPAPAANRAQRTVKASPYARRLARERGIDLSLVQGSGPGGRIVERDLQAVPAHPEEPARVAASPVARKLAQEQGLDLASVPGTGPGGRIVSEDVQRTMAAQRALVQAAEGDQLVPLSGPRRVTAQRMVASAQATARVTLMAEVDATGLVEWRSGLRERGEMDPTPSYTDLLVLIAARALREHPYMNARLESDDVRLLGAVHVGVAVDTPRGLLVPVLRDADRKPLTVVARELHHLADQARAGKSMPDDLSGGTFTVTNLGMFEVDAFTPIINLPECAILGVGRIVPKQVVHQGAPEIRQMMVLSLAFDHRLVDGAPAARFLQRVKHLVEEPLGLLA